MQGTPVPDIPDSSGDDGPDPREVRARLRICSIVGETDDPNEAVVRITKEIENIFAADSAIFALVNPNTGLLQIEYCIGFPEEHSRAAFPPGIGIMGWSAMHRTPTLSYKATQDPRYISLREATRSLMVAPLFLDDQVQGAIALESDTEGSFSEADLATLVLLTADAARVLQRLWQIRHLKNTAGQFEVLGRIAQEIARKLQPEELMDTVTRESHLLTDCRLATLKLHDPIKKTVRLQAAYPPGQYFAENTKEWEIGDSLEGTLISTRKQAEFSNVNQPEYFDVLDIPRSANVVSVLSTPLVAEKRVIGILSVYTSAAHRFSNDEKTLLKALANLASVSLQNAELYQRVFDSEESLRNSERLTTLGLLAAEIAHETRNPLTVIRLLFGALNLQFPEDDPRATDVSIIREKLDQLEGFVTRVLTFGKAPETMHSNWQADAVIRETCLLIRLKLNQSRIHLRYEPPESDILIDCNKAQIQQVLLNVILNSTQVMPDGGQISIVCRRENRGQHPVAAIEVSDTGTGIPPEYGNRIFDSFLSDSPGGTGLGLAIAKRIMLSHNGDIEIASTSPSGTTMRITLPLSK